jgi:hypothetical protein
LHTRPPTDLRLPVLCRTRIEALSARLATLDPPVPVSPLPTAHRRQWSDQAQAVRSERRQLSLELVRMVGAAWLAAQQPLPTSHGAAVGGIAAGASKLRNK